jgi:hypothetical protein
LLRLVALAQLELGDRYGAILAVAFSLLVVRETAAQDRQRRLDDRAVLAAALLAEGLGHGVHSLGCVLDAIDQVVRILAFEALVERERTSGR